MRHGSPRFDACVTLRVIEVVIKMTRLVAGKE